MKILFLLNFGFIQKPKGVVLHHYQNSEVTLRMHVVTTMEQFNAPFKVKKIIHVHCTPLLLKL